MRRQLALLLAMLACGLGSGCSMCSGPDRDTYPTYGGRVERIDRVSGRVGSIFSDPQSDPGTPAPDRSAPSKLPAVESSEPMELPPPQGEPQDGGAVRNDARRPTAAPAWR